MCLGVCFKGRGTCAFILTQCVSVGWCTAEIKQKLAAPWNGLVRGNYFMLSIRASVDTLCRDETDQISRDPHTKSILTRRERLVILRNAPAVAHGFISSCTYAVIPHMYLEFSTQEFAHTRFLNFCVIIIILFFIFFSKPAISKQE